MIQAATKVGVEVAKCKRRHRNILTTQQLTGVARSKEGANLSSFIKHRQKRGLIFENGGNAKVSSVLLA